MARLPVAGPIVIPNGIEVALHWSHPSGTFRNVFHGTNSAAGPVNPGLASTLFSAIKANAATTTFFVHLHTTVQFVGVSIKDLRAPNNPELPSTGTALAGTGPDDPVAISNALVVTLRTAFAGKGFRGRVYLAGFTIVAQDSMKVWDTGVGTDAVAFVEGIRTVLGTNNIPMAVGQRALQAGSDVHGNPMPARAAAVIPVISTDIANPRIDTQRRRLGR